MLVRQIRHDAAEAPTARVDPRNHQSPALPPPAHPADDPIVQLPQHLEDVGVPAGVQLPGHLVQVRADPPQMGMRAELSGRIDAVNGRMDSLMQMLAGRLQ